jgi:tetratricopeptide (TPR) repeat protein
VNAIRKRFAKLPGADEVTFRHVHNQALQERDQGKFEESLGTIDQFRELLISLKNEKEVEELAANIYNAWAGSLAKADDREAALKVYETAFERLPKNRDVENGLAYSVQEWLKQVHADDGEAAAFTLLTDVLNRFESSGDVRDVALNHVRLVIQALRQDGKFKEALAAVERHAKLLRKLKKPDEIEELSVGVYDAWAEKFMKARDWTKAIEVYEKSLKQFANSGHLKNNLAYCKQEQKKDEPKGGPTKE